MNSTLAEKHPSLDVVLPNRRTNTFLQPRTNAKPRVATKDKRLIQILLVAKIHTLLKHVYNVDKFIITLLIISVAAHQPPPCLRKLEPRRHPSLASPQPRTSCFRRSHRAKNYWATQLAPAARLRLARKLERPVHWPDPTRW